MMRKLLIIGAAAAFTASAAHINLMPERVAKIKA